MFQWMFRSMTKMGLNSTDQLIYLLMLARMNESRAVMLTYSDICEILPVTSPTAVASIKRLVSAGCLNVLLAKTTGNVYLVNQIGDCILTDIQN